MYWHKKKDMRAGGLWRCAVRKREVSREWAREKYDRDPIYRNGHLLANALRQRRVRVAAMRNRLKEM